MSREPSIVFLDRFLISKCFGRSPESECSTQKSRNDHKTPESPLKYEHARYEEDDSKERWYEFSKYFEENIENVIHSSHELLPELSRICIRMKSDRESKSM